MDSLSVFLTHAEIMSKKHKISFYPCWKRYIFTNKDMVKRKDVCVPHEDEKLIDVFFDAHWKEKVEELIVFVVEMKHCDLTKIQFLERWLNINVPFNDAIPITKYLAEIKTYPLNVILTNKQHGRLVESLECVSGKIIKPVAPKTQPKKVFIQPKRETDEKYLCWNQHRQHDYSTNKIKDEYLKDSLSLVLNSCDGKLTSHLNPIFLEFLFNAEIYCAETLQDYSDYMLITEVMERQGWKFDGYEGFSREPNLEKIKCAFNLIM